MKYLISIIILVSLVIASPKSYEKDVKSIDAIITALYDVISGEIGEERNWVRLRYLFHKTAMLRSVRKNKEGIVEINVASPNEYIKRVGPSLIKNGFFEREIGRRTNRYRYITHVFSTYDSRNSATEKYPSARGINSIQLIYDNNRWWVISILWNGETEEDPLPQKYLRMKK